MNYPVWNSLFDFQLFCILAFDFTKNVFFNFFPWYPTKQNHCLNLLFRFYEVSSTWNVCYFYIHILYWPSHLLRLRLDFHVRRTKREVSGLREVTLYSLEEKTNVMRDDLPKKKRFATLGINKSQRKARTSKRQKLMNL